MGAYRQRKIHVDIACGKNGRRILMVIGTPAFESPITWNVKVLSVFGYSIQNLEGPLFEPRSVCVNFEEHILVGELYTNTINVFGPDYKFLYQFKITIKLIGITTDNQNGSGAKI